MQVWCVFCGSSIWSIFCLSSYNYLQYWIALQRHSTVHIDGFVQDCSNSSALALEFLQSSTNPLIHVFISLHTNSLDTCIGFTELCIQYRWWGLNSMLSVKYGSDFKCVNFKHNMGLNGMNARGPSMKSTLVQVMAWCCQAWSQSLNQCWPRSPTPYGITRPQWA